MKATLKLDTIASLATPLGEGGIAVIRISGSEAPVLLSKIFKGPFTDLNAWKSHQLYYGRIYDRLGEFIDEGLAVWMKAPRSFTGEDVVELHLHGGRLISIKALETLYSLGARQALQGEFTQRAFLNGKIDLAQAEAIADLIAAQSEQALKLAQAQWRGALSHPVSALRSKLIDVMVQIEAAIDFPEEDLELLDFVQICKLIENARLQLSDWIIRYETGRLLREGLVVALVGKPNVGKSSLLNCLVREDAAIVHSTAGTTRDALDRTVQLRGVQVKFVDTAGLRQTNEEIEKEGIRRSKLWLDRADLALAVLDISRPLDQEDTYFLEFLGSKKVIWVLNKSDLNQAWNLQDLEAFLGFSEKSLETVLVSAQFERGIKNLEQEILRQVGIEALHESQSVLFNQLRHKKSLIDAESALREATHLLSTSASFECVASHLQFACQSLGEIIGAVSTDELLGEIFSRFCIGK